MTPSGTDVVVTMTYDADVEIPADAKAVIIAPSIVGDRYVQLTPVYRRATSWPTARPSRQTDTAVPLELDQIYSSLDDLTVALGPNGANKDGALTDLLETTAENFGGQGAQFHQTHRGLRQAQHDPRRQQGGAVRLGRASWRASSTRWPTNDKTVRQFNQSLSEVSDMLAGEREELAAALHNLVVGAERGRDLRPGEPGRPRAATSRASTGSRRSWSSSATRSTRC